MSTKFSPAGLMQMNNLGELSDVDGWNYWASKGMLSQCLRTIKIFGFSEPVIEFAQFLLQNAKGLEKMIFNKKNKCNDWQYYFGHEDFFKTIQKLLSLPRSSARAQIILL